jgi:hypothetical protein
LPFNNTAKFGKAITERLQAIEDGENLREWIVFSDFDSSKLKLIDNRRYPIRLQLNGKTLVVKMVHPVHEVMHNGLLDLIKEDMRRIGLRSSYDYMPTGSGRCQHHSRNSFKEANGSIAPRRLQPVPGQLPWPSFVIEAGWLESLRRLLPQASAYQNGGLLKQVGQSPSDDCVSMRNGGSPPKSPRIILLW